MENRVADLTTAEKLTTFALERPRIRRRRREPAIAPPVLPLFHCGAENGLVGYVGQLPPEVLLELARPLLMVGDPGMGKTSMAMHCGRRLSLCDVWNDEGEVTTAKALADRIIYHSSTELARQFASAIDTKEMPAWRRHLEEVPILIVDDLHAVADKTPFQNELASRLDARDERARATIITCRRLPTEIRGLRPGLVSRTLPGLTVPMAAPAGTCRRVILRELMVGQLPNAQPDQIAMLDEGLESGLPVRALAAAVQQLSLNCRMNDGSIDESAIQSAIDQVGTRKNVSIGSITTAVARQLGVKSADIRSGSRRQAIVRARSLAMWLSRQMTDQSLSNIGDAFGGRDHSTVLHAIRKTDALLDDDVALRRAADQVTQRLIA